MIRNRISEDRSHDSQQLGGIENLDEAIVLAREALALHTPGHPDWSTSLTNLALHLLTRYKQLGGVEDLDEAIVLAREALMLRTPGHPDRSMSLNNLGAHLWTQYRQLEGVEDLNEAIVLNRQALTLLQAGHPNRSRSLKNLAGYLSTRYEQVGRITAAHHSHIVFIAFLFCSCSWVSQRIERSSSPSIPSL